MTQCNRPSRWRRAGFAVGGLALTMMVTGCGLWKRPPATPMPPSATPTPIPTATPMPPSATPTPPPTATPPPSAVPVPRPKPKPAASPSGGQRPADGAAVSRELDPAQAEQLARRTQQTLTQANAALLQVDAKAIELHHRQRYEVARGLVESARKALAEGRLVEADGLAAKALVLAQDLAKVAPGTPPTP